jgi:uncharacterized protein (TIGR04551 family)
MLKASVVALIAAGPLLLASSSVAFAQTPASAAAAPRAAEPKAPKGSQQSKAGSAKPPSKGADANTTDKSHTGPNEPKPAATETPDDSTSSTAADATSASSDASESTSTSDPSASTRRPTLPAVPRNTAEPSASPVTGPLLPAGLSATPEPPRATAAQATPTDKEAKSDDSVFAEDWWSHARPILELHGYFRTRAEMFHNFSLGRLSQPDQALWTMPADNRYAAWNNAGVSTYGPALCTPGESDEVPGDSSIAADAHYACKNKNNSGANLRFRINPELHVSDNLRILSQIDLLDNLVFGSTPAGYANAPSSAGGYAVAPRSGYMPMSFFDNTTVPPTAGVNSYKNSIAVKRVWGEFSTPLGQLRFGRMPDHFGLGMYHNAGDGYDDDYQSTIDRIMFISSVKPLDFYFGGAWDFPSSGLTNENLQDPQAQPYNVSNLVNVRQFSLMLLRQKSPQLQRMSLTRGNLVVNGGAYLQYRWQDLAADNAGPCNNQTAAAPNGTTLQQSAQASGASLGCPSWGVTNAMVRRGARAFTPDLWLQVLYKKFRFEAEAVTVQGWIDNISNTNNVYGQNANGGAWRLRSYGIATEFQQRLLEDRLDLSLYWGWASGDPNAAQLDGSMGLQPGNNGLQTADGSNTFREFRFNPAYRIDLILNRNILSRIQGTYYLRPSVGYDFMRKPNGQRLGGNLAGIWTRASEYIQAPGHARDLGIEIDASIYFQSKDGALNDKPGAMGGFYTMLQYGLLFPMSGLGYPAGTASNIQAQFGNADLSTAQILRWYMGIFY